MPLELLEYVVYSKSKNATANTFSLEIDLPDSVPGNETWRVDRLSAIVTVVGGASAFTQHFEPVVWVYDAINPGLAAVPLDVTNLSNYPTEQGGGPVGGALRFEDYADYASPLTIAAGNQLAVVFTVPFANTAWTAYMRVQYARFLGVPGQPQPFAGAQPARIPSGI